MAAKMAAHGVIGSCERLFSEVGNEAFIATILNPGLIKGVRNLIAEILPQLPSIEPMEIIENKENIGYLNRIRILPAYKKIETIINDVKAKLSENMHTILKKDTPENDDWYSAMNGGCMKDQSLEEKKSFFENFKKLYQQQTPQLQKNMLGSLVGGLMGGAFHTISEKTTIPAFSIMLLPNLVKMQNIQELLDIWFEANAILSCKENLNTENIKKIKNSMETFIPKILRGWQVAVADENEIKAQWAVERKRYLPAEFHTCIATLNDKTKEISNEISATEYWYQTKTRVLQTRNIVKEIDKQLIELKSIRLKFDQFSNEAKDNNKGLKEKFALIEKKLNSQREILINRLDNMNPIANYLWKGNAVDMQAVESIHTLIERLDWLEPDKQASPTLPASAEELKNLKLSSFKMLDLPRKKLEALPEKISEIKKAIKKLTRHEKERLLENLNQTGDIFSLIDKMGNATAEKVQRIRNKYHSETKIGDKDQVDLPSMRKEIREILRNWKDGTLNSEGLQSLDILLDQIRGLSPERKELFFLKYDEENYLTEEEKNNIKILLKSPNLTKQYQNNVKQLLIHELQKKDERKTILTAMANLYDSKTDIALKAMDLLKQRGFLKQEENGTWALEINKVNDVEKKLDRLLKLNSQLPPTQQDQFKDKMGNLKEFLSNYSSKNKPVNAQNESINLLDKIASHKKQAERYTFWGWVSAFTGIGLLWAAPLFAKANEHENEKKMTEIKYKDQVEATLVEVTPLMQNAPNTKEETVPLSMKNEKLEFIDNEKRNKNSAPTPPFNKNQGQIVRISEVSILTKVRQAATSSVVNKITDEKKEEIQPLPEKQRIAVKL